MRLSPRTKVRGLDTPGRGAMNAPANYPVDPFQSGPVRTLSCRSCPSLFDPFFSVFSVSQW